MSEMDILFINVGRKYLMQEMEDYKKELSKMLDDLSERERFRATYKKKRLIRWIFRTVASIVLYIFLWKYEWVRWTLILYVPLSLFNLVMIAGFNFIFDRKLKKIRSRIES